MNETHLGFWDSPLSAQQVALGGNKLAFPRSCGHRLFWMECLADQGNRWVVRGCDVRTFQNMTAENEQTARAIQTLTPEGFSVASKVHEYGGIAYGVAKGCLVWINKSDQAVYRFDGDEHVRLFQDDTWRFGEPVVCENGVVLVAEHAKDDALPKNLLIFLDWHGELRVLHQGEDFYAAPILAPDTSWLVWITWNMPSMPWEQSQLWRADWLPEGTITEPRSIIDLENVAVFQPDFIPEGALHIVDDRRGVGMVTSPNHPDAISRQHAEHSLPLWQLGMRTYAGLGDGEYVMANAQDGVWSLGLVRGGEYVTLDIDGAHVSDPVMVNSGFAALIAPLDSPMQLRYWPLGRCESQFSVMIHAAADPVMPEWAVRPESLNFAGPCGIVQGYFYAPKRIVAEQLPPVIIKSHGGPSGQTDPRFNLKHQFWVSRGFAVFDINYSGSTGFGRAYRERLQRRWGELDVADCIAGLEFLIADGRVAPDKAFISGSSAGGLTTLGCLCASHLFAGGVCAYGVADLENLAAITHKFEACYLNSLVGTLPKDAARYRARSPLYHAAKISAPVLFLQGSKDVVVPPAQTESMVNAIRSRADAPEVEVVYFKGEGHGFRDPQNIVRALEAELEFYQRQLRKLG
ncbi:MAG: S9 family peptidase [Alphaproteobacteria bacterium]|nr:S9 family peptidase [Alphaproteobacteria bacterium]